jgi:flavodoxin
METLIVYNSKKGNTQKFAEEIAKRVRKINGHVIVKSIDNTSSEDIHSADLLFLGSPTYGKFLFGQKPDTEWVEFVEKLPIHPGKKAVLFTTYVLSTGSMFHEMKKYLSPKGYHIAASMKSRNGRLDYYSIAALKYAIGYKAVEIERDLVPLAEVS